MDKKKLKKIFGYEGSYFQKILSKYRNASNRKKKKLFMQEHGLEMIQLIEKVAEKHNVRFWVEFGTLLGAYRENSFISHDYDIDTGMYVEDFTQSFENDLLALGFIKTHTFYLKNVDTDEEMLTEATFLYKGFAIDVFFSKKEGNNRHVYVYDIETNELRAQGIYNVMEYTLPGVDKLIKLQINNYEVPAPYNVKDTLTSIYGETFMVPDPTWRTWEHKERVRLLPFSTWRGLMKGRWNLSDFT